MRCFGALALAASVAAVVTPHRIAGAQSRDGGAARPTSSSPQHYANRIDGVVKDAAGRAVSNIPVTLMRRIDAESRTFLAADRLVPADIRLRSITDARGAFSFSDRQPGTYYIVAVPQPRTVPDRSGFGITYYPGTASSVAAKPVLLEATGTKTADISLVAAALARIAGTVRFSTGKVDTSKPLQVAYGDELFGAFGGPISIRPDGSFLTPFLPPGTYVLDLRESAWPPPRGTTPIVSRKIVALTGTDLTGVEIRPFHMVKGRGRVVIGPAAAQSFKEHEVHVGVVPGGLNGTPGSQWSGVVQKDLTFEFATWPDVGTIMVSTPSGVVQAIVKLNGKDVTGTRIKFEEGHDITGLEVVFDRPLRPSRPEPLTYK